MAKMGLCTSLLYALLFVAFVMKCQGDEKKVEINESIALILLNF